MVSTRRQVINEQDRYGGFESVTAKEPVQAKEEFASSTIEVQAPAYTQNFTYSEPAKEQTRSFRYTENAKRYAPEAEVEVREEKVKVRRNREDLMPSIRKERKEKAVEEVSEQTALREERESLSTRTKVVLAVYLAIVVILAAVVIGTGIAITGSTAAVSRLETQVSVKQETLLQQTQTLNMITDETFLKGKAAEKNMINTVNPTVVTPAETIEPVIYKSRTNWFDKICDWLCGFMN